MESVYPPGPTSSPPNLTAASALYKRNAWLAMLGLAVFITLYFALSAWFAWTSWRLLSGMYGAGGTFDLWGFVAAICAAFLAVFMLKALFFIQHRYAIDDIEITRADEPQLFAFIDRLADEARAPRAHKVYLSARVNASVFYDLSLLNLIIPSKKNLEIGLGLVNVVTLGELKAVLAHEFGHFAQRSMAVGRWVYISQQIAGHVVARRDALDRFLQQLSRLDLRIAWVGWLLSIIVWSIRSMMDVLFRIVLIAQRALSRQMEFQADLVAVSLTGSDALIHALHKLNAADDAWDRALSFANGEAGNKRGVGDLFTVQTRIIERMREILNQPTYGAAPPLPESARETHRVFKAELAQPPRMWATHPPSGDREHNAKKNYVAAAVDERSAWELFQEPPKLRERMSAHVFSKATVEPVPMEQTLERLDKEYARAYFSREYRGAYLGRSPVRSAQTVAELYGPPIAPSDALQVIESLYPESLAGDIERLGEKQEEKTALEALRDQVAQAPGGIIRHNGVQLRRAELPRAIATLEREISAIRTEVEAHDQRIRGAHRAAGRLLEKGWPEYLEGLAAVLHYADHTEANLSDAQGYCSNIYRVVTADGHVSSDELTRLIEGCQQIYRVLAPIYTNASELTLDRTLKRRLEVESWAALLEEFKLPAPTRDNIGQWLDVIDGWVRATLNALSKLRGAALEQLLLAESQVAKFARDRLPAADAPPASTVPREYGTLREPRPRQKRLDWWNRFQTADGFLPGLARSIVAVGIVGGVVVLGTQVGVGSLTIYNALAVPVWVQVADQEIHASPLAPVTVSVPPSGKVHVSARTDQDEVIESFDEDLSGANAKYVYNVAGAVLLLQTSVVYYPSVAEASRASGPEPRPLGATRWTRAQRFDHIFEEPPHSIQLSASSNGYREVLSAAHFVAPEQQAQMITDPAERSRLVLSHARWDPTNSPQILSWLELASREPDFESLLAGRVKQSEVDVVLARFEQDHAQGDKHAAVCARHHAQAARSPAQPDLQYLDIRCFDDPEAQNAAFIAAQAKWPDHPWLMNAAASAYADAGDYAAAERLYNRAYRMLPAVREVLALATARMRRLTAREGSGEPLQVLAAQSPPLQLFLSIESGDIEGNAQLAPYALLANAQLAQASERAKNMGTQGHQVLRLIAGSEGATPEMIDAALAIPLGEEFNGGTAMLLYALAARAHRDPSVYAERIRRDLPKDGSALVAFLEAIRRGADPARARAALGTNNFQTRLLALNAAVVMLGNKAPASWRDEVQRGLFVGERGYIARRVPAPRADGNATRDSQYQPARIVSGPRG